MQRWESTSCTQARRKLPPPEEVRECTMLRKESWWLKSSTFTEKKRYALRFSEKWKCENKKEEYLARTVEEHVSVVEERELVEEPGGAGLQLLNAEHESTIGPKLVLPLFFKYRCNVLYIDRAVIRGVVVCWVQVHDADLSSCRRW